MNRDQKSAASIIISFVGVVFYALFLSISSVFVVALSLVQKTFATRSEVKPDRRVGLIHRKQWFIFIDVVATIVTYLAADVVRTVYYREQAWPEVVPNYGSTLRIHLMMLGALVVAWPAILHWLGWYKSRSRSWRWRIRNTGAAIALLALFMSTVALIGFREIYPRAQVGFCVVLLPLATGCVRIVVELIERALRRKRSTQSPTEPAW